MEKEIKNRKFFSKKRLIKTLVFLVFLAFVLNVNVSSSGTLATTAKNFLIAPEASAAPISWDNTKKEITEELKTSTGYPQKIVRNALSDMFLLAIDILLYAVFVVVGILMMVGGMLMDWAVNPTNFLLVVGNQAVYQGWTIVRDILNLAFILFLLFSAFCTIFQVEKYHLKKILLTLVIMALLVNFSFPVARFIIDTANVTMYYILNAAFSNLNTGLSGQLAFVNNITDAVSPPSASTSDPAGFTIRLLAAVIFCFLFAITMIVIGVLLVIRIVVLAILIIFAPIGFVGVIFKGTKIAGYADDWWNQLFKQSFFGPIMVFMIYMAITMMNVMNKGFGDTPTLEQTVKNLVGSNSGPKGYSTIIVTGTRLTVPIVILWVGLIAAQKMGAAGADVVVGQAKKIANWPAKWAGKGLRYAAVSGLKKVDRGLAGVKFGEGDKYSLSPRAFVEGWKKRAEDVERRVMQPAIGGWQDSLNFIMAREKTNYRQEAMQANIKKRLKEIGETSTEISYLKPLYKNALERGNYQDAAAMLRIMFGNNDQNEFMKQIKERAVGPESMKNMIFDDLTGAGMDESDAAKQLMDLSEIAFAKGNFGNYGMGIYDADAGKFRRSSLAEQMKFTAGKLVNIEPQAKFRAWHWNSFLVEGKKGEAGPLHAIGKNLLNKITAADVIQVHRARTDFISNLHERRKDILKYADNLENSGNSSQAKVVRGFVKEIVKQKEKVVELSQKELEEMGKED